MRGSVDGEALVAVAFSGGLDSSAVAKCASRYARVAACAAFAPGSADSGRVRQAASALGLELKVAELTKEEVARDLRGVDLPFEPTLMDRSLWCLYSEVAGVARGAGARVMLLGQLADELFGGYAKYEVALREEGEARVRSMMDADFRGYAERGRVRDVRACGTAVEARFPFEAAPVVEIASELPVSFKVRDGVRKAVLRRAAVLLGVPEGIAAAPKKAAQYSSGVQKLVAGSHF